MHRQLRSALQRTRDSSLTPTTLRYSFRPFSATPYRFDDDNEIKPPPPPRERYAAAARELGSLTDNNEIIKGAPARPIDMHSVFSKNDADGSPTGPPRIISMRSLPRRRGGASFPGPSGVSTPRDRPGRFPQSGGSRGGRGGRGGGRGGRGGRGGSGEMVSSRGRGGRQKFRRETNMDESEKAVRAREMAQFVAAEEAAQHDPADGSTVYTPSLTLESLVGYGPALPTAAGSGRVEAAMRSMRVLGGGTSFSSDASLINPEIVKDKAARKETVFFDTAFEREAVGDGARPPSDETKEAILRSVIQGRYAEPKFAPPGDVLATLRAYHMKDGTYRPQDGPALEAGVQALLSKQPKKGTGKAARA